MLSLRRLAPTLVLVVLALVLSACSATRHAPSTASDTRGKGIYKLGNPYQIDGVWYYPAEDWSYDETGIASWYGEAFHGKDTANGETFDLNAVTAAHRTLPLPTIVEVTNLDNGRSLQVRINDRGPYARGRIIDLSRRSAQLLGFEAQGTAKVHVRILVPETIQAASLARHNGGDDQAVAALDVPKPAPLPPVAAQPLAPPPGVRAAPPPLAPALPKPIPAPQVVVVTPPPPPVERVTVAPVKPSQIFIQAGAFSQPDNASRVKSRIDRLGPVKITGVRAQGIDMYRVRLGPIPTVEEADRLLTQVVGSGLAEARIVVD
jgi:peptidoglycan lytic transglycosylase